MKHSVMKYAHRFMQLYETCCRDARKEFGLSQTSFDIILFLANNPEYHTARDIVEIRKLKANLVSVNVEKLALDGYLIRKSVPGDRRKVGLYLTEKADPVVEKGRKFQQDFFAEVSEGVSGEDMDRFFIIMEQVEKNMDRMEKAKKKEGKDK